MKLNKLPPRIEPLHKPQSGWAATNEGKSASARGYGYQWRKLRERVMQRDAGLCVPCRTQGALTAAYAVDHITPKDQGGSDHESNLQAICNDCHKAKTAAERLGQNWTRPLE